MLSSEERRRPAFLQAFGPLRFPFANDPCRDKDIPFPNKQFITPLSGKFCLHTVLVDYIIQQAIKSTNVPSTFLIGSCLSSDIIQSMNRPRNQTAEEKIRGRYLPYGSNEFQFVAAICEDGHFSVVSVTFDLRENNQQNIFKQVLVYDSCIPVYDPSIPFEYQYPPPGEMLPLIPGTPACRVPSNSVPGKFLLEFQLFLSRYCFFREANRTLNLCGDPILRYAEYAYCPKQDNGYDCGLYAFAIILHLVRGVPICRDVVTLQHLFTADNITALRSGLCSRLVSTISMDTVSPEFFDSFFLKLTRVGVSEQDIHSQQENQPIHHQNHRAGMIVHPPHPSLPPRPPGNVMMSGHPQHHPPQQRLLVHHHRRRGSHNIERSSNQQQQQCQQIRRHHHRSSNNIVLPTPSHDILQQQVLNYNVWQCKMTFQEDGHNNVVVSLVEKLRMRNHDYIFPPHFSGESSETKLIKRLKHAAFRDGFNLVTGSRALPMKRNPNSKRLISIFLHCDRHRVRHHHGNSNLNLNSDRNTTSKRRCNIEDSCPFRISIYLHTNDGTTNSNRWFLSRATEANVVTAGQHRGHFRMDIEDIKAHSSIMAPDQRALLHHCSEVKLSSSQTAALLSVRGDEGLVWDPKQIDYLARLQSNPRSVLTQDASSADRLIQSMSNRPDVSCCVVSYDSLNGLVLLQTNRNRKQWNIPDFPEAKKLFTDNGFRDNDRLLLIFLFASDEEFRQLLMHPEVLHCDTTFGVEQSKKGLFTIAGVDGNNNAFNCARAFIPNEQTWVFHVLFHHALPAFWGTRISSRIRRFVTDGCPQQYSTLIRAFGQGESFPMALHSLCFYHLVVQKWRIKFRTQDLIDEDQRVVDETYNVMWDWCYYIETQQEFDYSRSRLIKWLQEMAETGGASPVVVGHVRKYIVESLYPYVPLWLGHYRGSSPGMAKKTSNLAESMHRSIKAGPHAVKSRLTTLQSAHMQMDKSEFLSKRRKRNYANAVSLEKLNVIDDISNYLTKYAEGLSRHQWKSASNYYCVALSPKEFLVYRQNRNEDMTPSNSPRCRFYRLRVVRVVSGNYLSCTCQFASEYKMPCKHMFRVVLRRTKEMFAMRWYLWFQHFYKRNGFEDVSRTMDLFLNEENNRNYANGQQIPCNCMPNFPTTTVFPLPVCGVSVNAPTMNDDIVRYGILRYSHLSRGTIFVTGDGEPQSPSANPTIPGMEMSVSYSATVRAMIAENHDMTLIQNTQDSLVRDSHHIRKDTYAAQCLDVCKEIVKLSENTAATREEFMSDMNYLFQKWARRTRQVSSQSKIGPHATMEFPASTTYTTSTVARKGWTARQKRLVGEELAHHNNQPVTPTLSGRIVTPATTIGQKRKGNVEYLFKKVYDGETTDCRIQDIRKFCRIKLFDKVETHVSKWAGLQNDGNTCYINSSLQALFSITAFMKSIAALANGANDLVLTLTNLWSRLNDKNNTSPASTRDVKAVIDQLTDRFSGCEQRDAHEFLSEVVDAVHEELTTKGVKTTMMTTTTAQKPNYHQTLEPTDEYFRMNVQVCLTCKSCGYSRTKEEMYRNLSLDIDTISQSSTTTTTTSKPSVESCLESFFQPEDRVIKCDKCYEGHIATQTMSILSKPRALLLHLKRFMVVERPVNDENNPNGATLELEIRKNQAAVDLDKSVSLDSYLSDSYKPSGSSLDNTTYSLKSIVRHIGETATSGHYKCNALRGNTWVSFDDRIAKEENLVDIIESINHQKTAYMFLYSLD